MQEVKGLMYRAPYPPCPERQVQLHQLVQQGASPKNPETY